MDQAAAKATIIAERCIQSIRRIHAGEGQVLSAIGRNGEWRFEVG
jgi:hypothetical protein